MSESKTGWEQYYDYDPRIGIGSTVRLLHGHGVPEVGFWYERIASVISVVNTAKHPSGLSVVEGGGNSIVWPKEHAELLVQFDGEWLPAAACGPSEYCQESLHCQRTCVCRKECEKRSKKKPNPYMPVDVKVWIEPLPDPELHNVGFQEYTDFLNEQMYAIYGAPAELFSVKKNKAKKQALSLDTNWDSLHATKSRGYPIFDGVPARHRAPRTPPEVTAPLPCKTTSDIRSVNVETEQRVLGRKSYCTRTLPTDHTEGRALQMRIDELYGEIKKVAEHIEEEGLVDSGGLQDWLDRPCGVPTRRSQKTKVTL